MSYVLTAKVCDMFRNPDLGCHIPHSALRVIFMLMAGDSVVLQKV
jgi:hypothetical protein